MKRLTTVAAVVAAVLVLAAPVAAHEEIEPSTIPTGKPVFFTLSAANEKTTDLVKVTVAPPAGLDLGATTRDPAGWSVDRTDTAITWSGGAVRPDHFEQWGFEIEGADQPGTLTWNVTMVFADGSSGQVQVPVTATAAGTASVTPSAPARTASSTPGSASTGRANAALVVAAAAAVIALVALGLGAARRARPAPATPDAQDW